MWSLQKFSDPRRRTLEKHPRLHPRSDSLSQTSQQIRGKCLNSGWCQWIWSWRLPVVCCSTKNLLNFIQMLFDVDVWKWSTAVTVPKVWQLSGRTESCHEYIIYQETGNWTSRRHPQQTASNISPAQFTWMTEEESRGFTAPHSISADSLPRQSEKKRHIGVLLGRLTASVETAMPQPSCLHTMPAWFRSQTVDSALTGLVSFPMWMRSFPAQAAESSLALSTPSSKITSESSVRQTRQNEEGPKSTLQLHLTNATRKKGRWQRRGREVSFKIVF